MSRKHCKRKVYQKINTLEYVISGVRVTPDAELNALHLRELSALEAMTHGRGTLQEWSDLKAALNICETGIRMGIGKEATQACQAAQEALIEAARRFEATGKMGLSGANLVALRDLLEWHHLQRTSVDRATYERVIKKTLDRVHSKAPEVFEL